MGGAAITVAIVKGEGLFPWQFGSVAICMSPRVATHPTRLPPGAELLAQGQPEYGVHPLVRGSNQVRVDPVVGDLEEAVLQAGLPHEPSRAGRGGGVAVEEAGKVNEGLVELLGPGRAG